VATDRLLAQYDSSITQYGVYGAQLRTLLERILPGAGITVHSITSRVKSRASFERKLSTKGDRYQSLTDITDIAGVRIITYLSDDVDKIADLVEREFAVDRANSIDKRGALDPDRFGYNSLHYVIEMSPDRILLSEYREFATLKAELQIRSILQHAWAEIEHDLGYKNTASVPRDVRRRFSRLAGILELADSEFVQLRNSLARYEEGVGAQIKEEPSAVDINRLSLSEFCKTSEYVKRLDIKVAQNIAGTLADDVWIDDSDVSRLQYFGIATIAQLENAIAQNETRIVRLSELLGTEPDDDPTTANISPGISLFYLSHVLAAARGAEAIIAYLDTFHIGSRTPRENVLDVWLGLVRDVPLRH
jgi:ppGpp synthetase/RelA/SpoT-type nucleotidyltranferase